MTSEVLDFIKEVARWLSSEYDDRFDWWNFPLKNYIATGRVMLCRDRGRLIGIMLSKLSNNLIDPKIVMLKQDVLYARPGTRAAYWLMKDFIDFGKSNANHIITMIGEKTNIKSESLERLGFKKAETWYRLEV